MNGIQIPGISNPEAIIPITGEKVRHISNIA